MTSTTTKTTPATVTPATTTSVVDGTKSSPIVPTVTLPNTEWSTSTLRTNDVQLREDKNWNQIANRYYGFVASDAAVEKTAAALLEKKHKVTVVDTPAAALTLLTTQLPQNASVAFGGSVTLEEIGFIDAVKLRSDLHNYRALAFAAMAKGDMPGSMAIRMEGMAKADYFFTSLSALTESGEMVSADASGTRVTPLLGGAKNVVVVVSANKIVPTMADALDRLVNYIVPIEGAHMRGLYKMPGTKLVNQVTISNSGFVPGRFHVIIVKGHSLGY